VQPEFPRLYAEQPELPPVVATMHFVARRWPFGPCTVARRFRLDGELGAGDHTIPADWHKDGDAEWIAREILWLAKCRNDGDVPRRFAREVLARLPRDGWELSQAEVQAWAAEHAPEPPPVVREPPPPFEERVKAKLRELGMLDGEA
jgi:hypothetical protein